MSPEDRKLFWEAIETGDNPLLSVMSGLVEKWGMPAVIMSLGDIGRVLSEDAIDADLTPNQRGLIMSACAHVCNLSDHMHAEMDHLKANK